MGNKLTLEQFGEPIELTGFKNIGEFYKLTADYFGAMEFKADIDYRNTKYKAWKTFDRTKRGLENLINQAKGLF